MIIIVSFLIFIDYDGTNGLKCCSADYRHMLPDQLSYYGCYPIEVPADDPYYSQYKFGCAHNIRSQPIFSNDCKLGSADIVSIDPFLCKF